MASNDADRLKAIAKVLKKKFTNMTVEETIDLAVDILKAVDDAGPF